ncbi:MAG: class I SAM-dependent methyltransferase [Candidatus Bathyanammoxibius sp.]
MDQIPVGSNVLDLCCGGGEMSLAIAKQGATVTGVDYVKQMCYLCQELFAKEGYQAQFHNSDATNLPLASESFSHVVCAGSSLNSMPNEDARSTIREIARVVKPGGTVYLAILNPHGLRNLLAAAKGVVQGAPRWGFYYRSGYGIDPMGLEIPKGLSFLLSAGKLKQYMREAGLRYRCPTGTSVLRPVTGW